MDLSRRALLKASGLTAALTATSAPAYARTRGFAPIVLTGTAVGTAQYQYHPFRLPAGVTRIDVKIVKDGPGATGIGIFDPRGSHFATLERPNGFRGIFGEERSAFFVATDSASDAFIPGPMPAGEWTIVVPVFNVQRPVKYTITVQPRGDRRPGRPFRLGKDLQMVLDEPGWYRGDLHAHTPDSSDAFNSKTALTPRQWADTCREIGLDYLALTDHNVVSQNFAIAQDAGDDVLLMAGEEMTNWFYGHATVSGINPGDWFDWRQLPAHLLTPAALRDPRTGTIKEFLRSAKASGAYVSAAHPLGATLAWRFFAEGASDPAARTDAVEVWTGPFQPDDQASVDAWDAMNRAGQHLVANGGSDLHGVKNTNGFYAGTPTTVVHANALSKQAVLSALKAGRSFITRTPDGVELYLSGMLPDQRQIPGGTLYGAPTDLAAFEVVVRRAAGMRLVVLRDGVPVSTTPIGADEQTVSFSSPVGAGGFVRVEVRSAPTLFPNAPLGNTLDMEALTNPVWLVRGDPPAGTVPDRTVAPAKVGPRRSSRRSTAPASPAGAAGASGVVPPVGGTALAAVAMTHSEFLFRARGGGQLDGEVTVTGQVSAVEGSAFEGSAVEGSGADGAVIVSRWVEGCCSQDAELTVRVRGANARLGDWVAVTGTPCGEVLDASSWRRIDEPASRREG